MCWVQVASPVPPPADAVLHACPVQLLPARLQPAAPAGPLHEKAGGRGEPAGRGGTPAKVSGEGGPFPSLTSLPIAGPAGDRLGGGEAGDGAQARCHPAAGETLTSLPGGGAGRGVHQEAPPASLSMPLTWEAHRPLLSPRPAHSAGVPILRGLNTTEQEGQGGQVRGGQRASPLSTQ